MVTHDRQLDWIGDAQERRNSHPVHLCRHGQRPLGPEGSYLMGGLKVWIDYGQVVGVEEGP